MPLHPSCPLDADQQRVVDHLDRLGEAILGGDAPPGVYLHGAVGRGKTWLCDQFFEQLPVSGKRRVHFHGFMHRLQRDVWNQRLQDPSAAGNAVDRAVAALLEGIDLLYFDEFHVHDSGDAALVLRVLDDVLASNVTLLATSNYRPHALLPGPFHHVFERGIRLIEENLQVVQFGGSHDYRRHGAGVAKTGFAAGSWLHPGSVDQLGAVGLTLPVASERQRLTGGGHRFAARRASGRQLWFTFAELCERDSAVADYLGWAADYDTWVLEGVPRLADASPQAAKRFGNLIDVLCDQGAILHVLSEHSLDAVFGGTRLPLDSDRTASRLAMLQGSEAIHTQP
ncbi:cell division protein ZapE [Homoserinimonas sp. A520]